MEPHQIDEIDWQGTYNAAMDSVNLLNRGKPDYESPEDWADCVNRNVGHLKTIVDMEGWPAEFDMTPFNAAIAAND